MSCIWPTCFPERHLTLEYMDNLLFFLEAFSTDRCVIILKNRYFSLSTNLLVCYEINLIKLLSDISQSLYLPSIFCI